MTRALASVLCVIAALALACSNSPTAPADTALISPLVSGATMGSEGQGAGPPIFSNAAVVVRGDLGCGLVDGLGNWFPPGWPDEVLPCGTEVSTYSKNGNANITVRASGVPNPTGKTVHWGPYNPGQAWADSYPTLTGPPYPCFVLGPDRDLNNPLFTVNWHAMVTPSGQAMLTCTYSKKWEFQWPE